MFQNSIRIIVKGEDQTDKISNFNESEGKVDITYKNGKTYTYKKENVQIDYSALSDKRTEKHFQYLKQIAKTVSLEDPDGGNILFKHYNKINFIEKKCMLSAFLSEKLYSTELKNMYAVIYPFGFNLSQKSAVDKALNNTLSIIEGPPGTGKTQTILNIIANAVMRNENVAIVSSNNSATANVLEKLLKYNVDFIAAYLGSYDNKNKFIESQKELPQDIKTWKLSDTTRISILKSISNLFTALNTMHEKRNKLSSIRQELDSIEVEHRHFIEYFSYDNEKIVQYLKPINTSADALKLWFICEKYVKNGKIPWLITRIINRFKYGIFNKKFYSIGSDMISICQYYWYITRISELTLNTSMLQNELDQFNFKEKMDKYTSLSMQLFRDHLSKKYKDNKRRIYTLDDLRDNSRTFINDYPVILSTTYSICSSLSSTIIYDYIIIDEASQVNIATGALALSCAKKAVVVGDLKQLPNVVKINISIFSRLVTNRPMICRLGIYSPHKSISFIVISIKRFPFKTPISCRLYIIIYVKNFSCNLS